METSATIGRGTCSGVPAEAAVEEEVFDARRLVGPAGAALACQGVAAPILESNRTLGLGVGGACRPGGEA
jgi:hypothetical protein